MYKKQSTLLFVLGITLLTTLFSVAALPISARAQERDTGYQLVITQQSTTSGYEQNSPLTAVLSFPIADAPIDPVPFRFTVAGKTYGLEAVTYMGQSTGQATFQFNDISRLLPIGQYSIRATYLVAATQTTVQSNTLTHTINKADLSGMTCLNLSGPSPARPGQMIAILIQLQTNDSHDPHIGTYDISFTGPDSITYHNLTVDSANQLNMKAPSITGNYTWQCQFNGTSLYNVLVKPSQPFRVGLDQPLGTIRVYSNPTPIVLEQPTVLYFVFPTAPGLPAPTGTFILGCIQSTSYPITLGQGGSVTTVISFSKNYCSSGFSVIYEGDFNYASANQSFSLTNPPIPGAVPPTATVTSQQGNATATPIGSTSITPTTIADTSGTNELTPTPTAFVASAGGAANTTPTTTPTGKTGSGNLWIVALLAFLGLGGGGATGIWYLRRRTQPVGLTDNNIPKTPSSELTEPLQPPFDGNITQS